jgi:hypothetical protein
VFIDDEHDADLHIEHEPVAQMHSLGHCC